MIEVMYLYHLFRGPLQALVGDLAHRYLLHPAAHSPSRTSTIKGGRAIATRTN